MALMEKDRPVRLEDFIALAREGKRFEAEIKLEKQSIVQKAHPDETEEGKSEINAYLLIGDYTFRMEGESRKVSKVYAIGYTGESLDADRLNKNIANERLKMDYQRLKDAHITFEPRHFESKYFA